MTIRFDDPAIQQFLATREVVVLATLQVDGGPLAMPMWFVHDGAVLAMISVARTQKVRNLRHDPRVCVVAEAAGDAGIRYVAVRGRAELLPDGPERRQLADRFVERYRPRVERLWGGRVMPDDRVLFRIVPTQVRTVGLA